jgi:hypothetical protein
LVTLTGVTTKPVPAMALACRHFAPITRKVTNDD